MTFKPHKDGYLCEALSAHVEGTKEFCVIGTLKKINGYWWFLPRNKQPISCGDLRRIAAKLSELNS